MSAPPSGTSQIGISKVLGVMNNTSVGKPRRQLAGYSLVS